MLVTYLVLTLLGLPFWIWLLVRIWRVSKPGAALTFFLIVPAFYWGYRLWHDTEANIRVPLIVSMTLNLLALPFAIALNSDGIEALTYGSAHMKQKAQAAEHARLNNPEMERWCREQNDASFDPAMGMCVEPEKSAVQARSKRDNVFDRLGKHLSQSGVRGEFDSSTTATIEKLKAIPEIADVTSYHFLPLSMSQQPVLVLLCVSETACDRAENQAKGRGTNITIRNRNLLMFVQPQALDDVRVKALRKAFSGFTPI
jgi:hypothetical protein